MADLIGHFIANWYAWALGLALVVVVIMYFCYATGGAEIPWKKKEWWQDREKKKAKKG